jgi:hypothetical protein
MKILNLEKSPSGQFVYSISENGNALVSSQYGTHNVASTVEQAKSRFSFDVVRSSFVTGRNYRSDDTPQKIVVEYVPFFGSIWDENARDVVLVGLSDLARGITEKVKVIRCDCNPADIHSAVLNSYDDCNYAVGDVGQTI